MDISIMAMARYYSCFYKELINSQMLPKYMGESMEKKI